MRKLPLERHDYFFIVGVLVLGFLVYAPLLKAGFIWDDDLHVLNDALLQNLDGLYKIWFSPGKSVWNYWPLTRTNLWLEHYFFGMDPRIFHAVNIGLHLTSSCIFYFVLKKIGIHFFPASISAILFAIHPVMMESVAWVTERSNMLSMVFYLLSIYFFIDGHFNNKNNIFTVCIFFTLGMLSKSSIVMLPVILLLISVYFDHGHKFEYLKKLLPVFILSFGFGLINIYFEHNHIGSVEDYSFHRSFAERLIVAGMIPLFYLKQLLFPVYISFFYPKWAVQTSSLLSYAPVFVVMLLTGLAIFMIVRRDSQNVRILSFLWIAFLASLFPVLNIFYVYGMKFSFVADHWVYLATLPVFVALGLAANSMSAFLKNGLRNMIVGLIILVLAFSAWSQTAKYQNVFTLLLDTTAKTPGSFIAHNNLSVEYIKRGEWDKALHHADLAAKLYPEENRRALINKAIALTQLNRYNEALVLMAQLKSEREFSYSEHFVVGTIYFHMENYPQSLVFLDAALTLEPDFKPAIDLRSRAREKLQDPGKK